MGAVKLKEFKMTLLICRISSFTATTPTVYKTIVQGKLCMVLTVKLAS